MAGAFVQQVTNSATSSATTIAAASITPTAGNVLVAWVCYGSNTQTGWSVADNSGDGAAWTAIGSFANDSAAAWSGTIFTCTPTSGNARVITATGPSAPRGILVTEWSGATATGVVGHCAGSNPGSSGANVITSGNMTVTAQPYTIIGFALDIQGAIENAGTSPIAFTGLTSVWNLGSATTQCRGEYAVSQTATGSKAATFQDTGFDRHLAGVIALQDASGGGATTLTAASGTYGYTGQAENNGTKTPGAQGSYSYTGQAATFSTGTGSTTLLASSGSYGYVGAGANSDLALDAANGSYGFTGNAATLGSASSLTCASGSYGYTGEAVTLSSATGSSFTILCSVGSYGYVGAGANSDLEMAGAQGSYTYTGESASFSGSGSGTSVTMLASSGNYGYIGAGANSDLAIDASNGSYGYTGFTDNTSSVLPLSFGSYGYSGQSAGFGQVLSLGSGSYGYTGQSSGALFGLPASQGSYGYTGSAAVLAAGSASAIVLTCDAGSYVYTGQNNSMVGPPPISVPGLGTIMMLFGKTGRKSGR